MEKFNQKWAMHKMLRPSSVAVRRHLPPRGEGSEQGRQFLLNFALSKMRQGEAYEIG